MNLRKHVRQIQLLENKAAEKAGARFAMFEMINVIKKNGRDKYIQLYIDSLLKDIKPELEETAREGVKLFNQINGGKG